jgi:hypothetical protein
MALPAAPFALQIQLPERTFGEQNPLDRGRINGIGVKIPAAAIADAWQMDVETQMIPALIESRNSAETSAVSFKSCSRKKNSPGRNLGHCACVFPSCSRPQQSLTPLKGDATLVRAR